MRLYTGLSAPEGSFAEVLDTIGPLANDQEISTRFITDLATDLTFFTDNNGLELQERVTYVRCERAREGDSGGGWGWRLGVGRAGGGDGRHP